MKPLAAVMIVLSFTSQAQELYRRQPASQTRWATFENPRAAKGQAGLENKGAKGRPFQPLAAGETKTLLDVKGSGSVRRIWITISDRDPATLRALKLEMYWDGAKTPAVSVPFGDFFGAIHGRAVKLENEFFVNPEGRSFNCYIPMPFRTGARITLTNESGHLVKHLFYDVDILATTKPDPEALYFHAIWRREQPTQLGRDFEILPQVKGEGRFLGTHVGVIAAPDLTGWWGEGEIKMFLDGDITQPTIAGTGTEDYIGTGWGQGLYQTRFMGSTVGDKETRQYAFYRYHVPDPVYFHTGLRVTLQQMGGDSKANVVKLLERGAAIRPVSIDVGGELVPLMDKPDGYILAADPAPADSWVNMYQRQDVSAVALFYLNAAENGLPPLAPVAQRTTALPPPPEAK